MHIRYRVIKKGFTNDIEYIKGSQNAILEFLQYNNGN